MLRIRIECQKYYNYHIYHKYHYYSTLKETTGDGSSDGLVAGGLHTKPFVQQGRYFGRCYVHIPMYQLHKHTTHTHTKTHTHLTEAHTPTHTLGHITLSPHTTG